MPSEDNPLLNRPQSTSGNTGGPVAPVPPIAANAGEISASRTAPPATPGANVHHHQQDAIRSGSARDILEAVILALILAFTFRTFMVEAYVIPTGSMAPTLNGAHFRVICPQCGWVFDTNANVDQQWVRHYGMTNIRNGELTNSYAIRSPRYITCPNCHFPIPVTSLPDQPVIRRQMQVQNGYENLYFPYARNGDRILVMKYLYWFARPQPLGYCGVQGTTHRPTKLYQAAGRVAA